MALISQDRLVRKEVALGVIRELAPPENHVGLTSIAPFESVESDDVIFEYIKGAQDGLAPARAEDAESELAMKDDFIGEGRASIIDWAIKDRYKASDVSRYRENIILGDRLGENLPLTISRMVDGFDQRLARDEVRRRRKLDNRFEWLIMTSLDFGVVSYDDGKVKFSVDWGRPADQHDENPPNGLWTSANAASMDPVDDIAQMREFMRDRYSVTMDRAYTSAKVIRSMQYSDKFQLLSLRGFTGDPNYTIPGWAGGGVARAWVEQNTGVTFIEYDSVYRTRPIGSQTTTNNRFMREDKVVFLPSVADISEIDDMIGFGKTLTSPHPEGNWQSGYYEWERSEVDPWGADRGTGCKGFPVFPHMDLTYHMNAY